MSLVASAVAYVPINTASAVETTWAGTADMLREAAEETRAQVTTLWQSCLLSNRALVRGLWFYLTDS